MHQFLLIIPTNSRRATLFNEALSSFNLQEAILLDYTLLENDVEALDSWSDTPLNVKIDSTADSEEVERYLLRLGYEEACRTTATTIEPAALANRIFPYGELRYPTQQYLGFKKILQRLNPLIQSQLNWRSFSNPEQIALMFDKCATHQFYKQHGIPVADSINDVESFDDLIARMEQLQWSEVYVKHRYGSTASGMIAIRFEPRIGIVAATTMRARKKSWFNSLRLVVHRHSSPVANAVDYLVKEGAHIERAIPKAKIDGMSFDCRVVMIAGKVAFVVLRKSNAPFTNLHLGGVRGTYDQLCQVISDDLLEQAWECCRKIARLHKQMVIGIDLLFHQDRQSFYILECNAFGDLLPNLTRNGRSVYQWQIEAREQWQWWHNND